MKNLLLPLLMFIFCACDNEDEPHRMPLEDFPQLKLFFTYTDMDGNDLLSPSNENNILDNDISVEFKGEKYYLDKKYEVNPNGADAYHIDFQGLKLQPIGKGQYAIAFGFLDGSIYYRDETISVSWGNSLGNIFSIYSIWSWTEDGVPNFYRVYREGNKIVEEGTATPILNCIYDNYAPEY